MTGIQWTDEVWNPTTGCDRISDGCEHCYALTMARRLKGMGQPKYQRDGNLRTSGPGFGLTVHPDALALPLQWREPRRIFVNSMSDLFHRDVPDEFIVQVFTVMAQADRHVFQLLTKRHGRMRSILSGDRLRIAVEDAVQVSLRWPLPNVWLGVSTENQHWADIRIPALLSTPAAVRFISAEPLLGPLDLGVGDPHRGHDGDGVYGFPHPRICLDCSDPEGEDDVQFFTREPDACGISWVIVGGESGPGARTMSIRWARTLVQECQSADIPVFVKQLGSALGRELGAGPKGGDWEKWPEDLRVREFPHITQAVTR
jgi:protein gp37